MNTFFDWNPEYEASVIAIFLVSACFSFYWFIAINPTVKARLFARTNEEKAWINYVVFQKLTGVFFLGVIPALVIFNTTEYTINDLGVNFNESKQSLIYIIIMGALILLLNYFATNKAERLKDYPQMRVALWTPRVLLINVISWAAYLIAYEFLFRGVLLFLCYATFGFWPAAAINIALYSTTHIPKGAGETIGTFPYGLLLCYVTISTGSILVAIMTHLIMALSNDLFSIHHNPKMKFSK